MLQQYYVAAPVFLARHAAITAPNAIRLAVLRFHRFDDLLMRFAVMRVAGEHFIAKRNTVFCNDKTDANLLAIAAMIARMAVFRKRIAIALTLKIR